MSKPDYDYEIHTILEDNTVRKISINEAKAKILLLIDEHHCESCWGMGHKCADPTYSDPPNPKEQINE